MTTKKAKHNDFLQAESLGVAYSVFLYSQYAYSVWRFKFATAYFEQLHEEAATSACPVHKLYVGKLIQPSQTKP